MAWVVSMYQLRQADPARFTGGPYHSLLGLATEDFNRAYELMKYWRKLQGSGKLRETDNASTARDIEAEASPMLTDDDLRGIRTEEQRALGVIDDRIYGLDLQGYDNDSDDAPFPPNPDQAEVHKALTASLGQAS